MGSSSGPSENSVLDLLLKELILELLFSQHLSALLASPHQVGHHLISRSIWQVLKYLMALKSKSLSDLVREGLELAESNISWTDLVLLYYFLGDFY